MYETLDRIFDASGIPRPQHTLERSSYWGKLPHDFKRIAGVSDMQVVDKTVHSASRSRTGSDTSENKLIIDYGMATFSFNGERVVYVAFSAGPEADMGTRSMLLSDSMDTLLELNRLLLSNTKLQPGKCHVYTGNTLYSDDMPWEVQHNYCETDQFNKSCSKKPEWDDLIVDEEVKSAIKSEVEQFFSYSYLEAYKKLNLPYKRGTLLVGPPGCGKTLTARIIACNINVPFLVLRSVEKSSDLGSFFRSVDHNSPCVALLEDLGSLLKVVDLSEFLNILDGVNAKGGVFVIATTNDPGSIDEALLNRPSRFDSKHTFPLPSEQMRHVYFDKKLSGIPEIFGPMPDGTLEHLASSTKGYSYAMLQELVIQAMTAKLLHEQMSVDECLHAAITCTRRQLTLGDADKLHNATRGKEDRAGFLSSN